MTSIINKYLILILFLTILICVSNNRKKVENFSNPRVYNIYYINLKHREDRKKELLTQLKKLDKIPNTKFVIERIDAVKHQKGGIGCGESHIKALEKAKNNNLEQVIIIEDDIDIKENEMIKYFTEIESNKGWDVFIMSGHGNKKKIKGSVFRALGIQTTGMYIIKKEYYQRLQKCFQKSVDNMKSRFEVGKDIEYDRWAIDQNWKTLQKKDNWLILDSNLGVQREDYSDIENKKVDYTDFLK